MMNINSFLSCNYPVGLVLLSSATAPKPFERSVIIVIQHDSRIGTMGLCIDRPLRLTLDDFDEKRWGSFDSVPVYYGGPMQQNQIIVTSFERDKRGHNLCWRLSFTPEQAMHLLRSSQTSTFKAYCGYVGWRPGQLVDEIKQQLWLPVALVPQKLFSLAATHLWETLVFQNYPSELPANYLPQKPQLN